MTYYNGKSYTFTWIDGRRLATANVDGNSISYQYDVNGYRTGKTVGSTRTRYYWAEGRLEQENRNGTVITYYYDENNDVIGMRYNGTRYYFGKNQQGDILEIHNGTTVVAKYTYSAWGEITSITDGSGNAIAASATTNIANVNPFRYRGYYYDTDTGFYYLQSRYYDPVVKRFLNADSTDNLGVEGELQSFNLYSYCLNNPVNRFDRTGTVTIEILLIYLGYTFIATVGLWTVIEIYLGLIELGKDIITSIDYLIKYREFALSYAINEEKETKEESISKPNVKYPDVKYPGDDPTKSPGDDYEWRGQQPIGGEKGGYAHKTLKKSWHPDLNHLGEIGPHWDDNDDGSQWRVFSDGRIEPK